MEDEDFWGHPVKKENPNSDIRTDSTNRKSREPSLSKHEEKAIDISTEDLVKMDQLESTQERVKSASRIARDASRASGNADAGQTNVNGLRRPSNHTIAESEYRHTRSPSYTSEEETKAKSADHSADESEEEASNHDSDAASDKDDRKDETYSDRFETSEAASEDSEDEEKENKTNIADRLKPFLIEKTAEMEAAEKPPKPSTPKRVKIKKTKTKPKQTPNTQKPKLSPRAPAKLKREPVTKATTSKTFFTTGSRAPGTRPTGAASNDPMRRLRSAALRDEIEFLKKQLTESRNENRTLRQVQRRQEAALARLDTHRAAMPTLLDRQAEEVRIAKEQLRMQKEKQRELERVLRERDDRLIHALDKARRLEKTLKDKGIDYRPKAANSEAVEALKQQVEEKEKKIRDLERQVTLLTKNHKHQLNIEVMRHKETQRKLRELEEAFKNRKLDKLKGNHTTRTARRSTSEKAQVDRLAQSMNAGQARGSEMARSVLSNRDDSVEEDVLAENNTLLASLKGQPTNQANRESNNAVERSDRRPSRARANRRTTKRIQSTADEEGDSEDIGFAGATGRRRSSDKLFIADRATEKADNSKMVGASALEEALAAMRERSSGDQDRIRQLLSPPTAKPANASSEPEASRIANGLDFDKTALFNEPSGRKPDSKPSSVIDEILQPPKPVKEPPLTQTKPSSPPKTNADFLDDLFGPKAMNAAAPTQKTNSLDKDSKASSGIDSGFDHSVDSTPKQVQSAKGASPTKSVKSEPLDLDDELFSPKKATGPKGASNGLFPWEMDAVKKSTTVQEPVKKPGKPSDDLFSGIPGLGTVM